MRREAIAGLLVFLPGAGAVLADEGRIPVYQQSTLTQPGSYVLTRDIDIATGDAIVIDASDVTLDLNGMAIRSSDAMSGSLIRIMDGHDNIRVRNGRLRGGYNGFYYGTGGSVAATTLWLEEVELSGTGSDGINVTNARYFEMTSCKLRNIGQDAVLLSGGSVVTIGGLISGNQFADVANYGIAVGPHQNVVIRNNILSSVGGQNVTLSYGSGDIVEGNTLTSIPLTGTPTAGLVIYSDDTLVRDNVFNGYAAAIAVGSDGNRLSGNIVRNTMPQGVDVGDAVLITGGRNLIEGNQIEGNAACGIHFHSLASDNAYRDNMLRNNGGGAVCDDGTGNTDSGGNIN